MRNLHIWLIIALGLTISLIYMWSGLSHTMLPVDGTLKNRLGLIVGTDFQAFYSAGLMVVDGAFTDLYDVDAYNSVLMAATGGGETYSWSYPPVFNFFVAPLALFPFIPAMILWGVLPMAVVALVAYRAMPHPVVPVVAFFSPPLVHSFLAGQNGALTAAILGGGLLLLPARPVIAGLIFALAAYKPHLALLIPVCLIAGGHYRALAAMAGGGAFLVVASLIAFGTGAWISFFAQVDQHMGYVVAGNLPLARIPTIYVTASRLLGNAAAASLIQGAVSLAVVILAAWTWRRTRAPAERALVLVSATLLATPYAFDYDLAVLAVPFAWAIREYAVHRAPALDPVALMAVWFAPILVFFIDAGIGCAILIALMAHGVTRQSSATGGAGSATGRQPVSG